MELVPLKVRDVREISLFPPLEDRARRWLLEKQTYSHLELGLSKMSKTVYCFRQQFYGIYYGSLN
jgi:hypothetical protein